MAKKQTYPLAEWKDTPTYILAHTLAVSNGFVGAFNRGARVAGSKDAQWLYQHHMKQAAYILKRLHKQGYIIGRPIPPAAKTITPYPINWRKP